MRINKTLFTLLVCSCALAANASLVVVNETIDISGFSTTPTFVSQTFALSGPVSISTGDQVEMNIDFGPMQRLRVEDAGSLTDRIYGWLQGTDLATFTISNAQITLNGFSGSPGTSSTLSLASQSAGNTHLGPSFSNTLAAGEYVEFSGYSVTYDVDAISTTTKNFNSVWLVANQASLVQAVPEPHQYLMFGSLCIIGLVGRFGRQLPNMIRARLDSVA